MLFCKPQPLLCAKSATPSAVVGKRTLKHKIFRKTIPRLENQRRPFLAVNRLRAANSSHEATNNKTPMKKPNLIMVLTSIFLF